MILNEKRREIAICEADWFVKGVHRMNHEQIMELIETAADQLQYSYVPYSGFRVGAALLAQDGSLYTGCNIENVSYGATNCAERTAIFKAVSEGERHIKKIAIVSSAGKPASPCGICRQVLSECLDSDGFVLLEIEIIAKEFYLKDLLPYCFCPDSM